MEFTELREQGVWGEATHTREMCVCARLLKSGNEGYSKENRQNVTNMTIYQIWQFDHILQSEGFEGVL